MPTPPRSPNDITGLLLAGGRGARMGGVDKGLVAFHGEPMAAHVLRRLQPQVGCMLISANRHAESYRAWAPVLADDDPTAFAGPLAGIARGLRAMTSDWLAVAPCDLPCLPDNVVARLAAALDGAAAAYAMPAGQSHSLVCLLHRSLAGDLDDALARREARVSRWFEEVDARAVPFTDAAHFTNLNSPAELAAADQPDAR